MSRRSSCVGRDVIANTYRLAISTSVIMPHAPLPAPRNGVNRLSALHVHFYAISRMPRCLPYRPALEPSRKSKRNIWPPGHHLGHRGDACSYLSAFLGGGLDASLSACCGANWLIPLPHVAAGIVGRVPPPGMLMPLRCHEDAAFRQPREMTQAHRRSHRRRRP